MSTKNISVVSNAKVFEYERNRMPLTVTRGFDIIDHVTNQCVTQLHAMIQSNHQLFRYICKEISDLWTWIMYYVIDVAV